MSLNLETLFCFSFLDMPELKVFSDKYVPYGATTTPDFKLIQSSRDGLLRSYVDQISQMVGLTDNEMAYILGMTSRNLHRITPDKRLGIEASERLLLLRNILIHAMDTFEGKQNVVLSWLRTSIPELNDQAPVTLMDTVTGFGLVNDVLGRLDYGLPA